MLVQSLLSDLPLPRSCKRNNSNLGDDENELERKLRLEKVVASKQLRLAVETGDRRRKKSNTGE